MATGKGSKALVLLLFAAMFAFQGAKLDSDPSPLKTFDDVSDEGLWQHSARCKVLFGRFLLDDVNQDVIAAPLFTAIQWASFSLFGESVFSARLICLGSLWLTLVMLYFTIRRESTPGRALLVVAILGLMHEMLMYTKWSTPILPELAMLTAVLFFWELGRAGNPRWMSLSGTALIAAIAMKLTSVFSCLSTAVFVVGVYAIRKEVDGRRLRWFLVGVVTAAIPLGAFYLYNHAEVQFFLQTIGAQNAKNTEPSLREVLDTLFLCQEDFVSPGFVILLMLLSLWILDRVVDVIRHGFRQTIERLSTAEFYALCWLAGSLIVLAVFRSITYRRFIMLYVPVAILAGSSAFRQITLSREDREGPWGGVASVSSTAWRCVLATVVACVWWFYARLAVQYTGIVWLDPRGEGLPRGVYVVVLACCALIAATYFVGRRPRTAVTLLVGVFLAGSVALSAVWYASASYTLRDESRALVERDTAGPFLLGTLCYQLAMENQTVPICDPWIRLRVPCKPFNPWFAEVYQRCELLMLVDEREPNSPINAAFREVTSKLPAERIKKVKDIALCPVPLVGGYRYQAAVYRIEPLPAEAIPWPRALRSIHRACE